MFGPSFDKMSDGMKWFIVVPTSLLLFTVAWFVFTFTMVTVHAKYFRSDVATGKVSIEVINDALSKTQKLSDYLDQQQSELGTRQSSVNAQLNLAKTNPKKFLNKDINTAVAGLNAATTGIKKQSAQLVDQQKNVKALQDELAQLKQAAKQSPAK